MRRIFTLLAAMLLALGMMAAPAMGQPPPHDHTLEVPGTGDIVQVGPPRCELGEMLDTAFLNFHGNVHVGAPATSGGLVLIPDFCP